MANRWYMSANSTPNTIRFELPYCWLPKMLGTKTCDQRQPLTALTRVQVANTTYSTEVHSRVKLWPCAISSKVFFSDAISSTHNSSRHTPQKASAGAFAISPTAGNRLCTSRGFRRSLAKISALRSRHTTTRTILF